MQADCEEREKNAMDRHGRETWKGLEYPNSFRDQQGPSRERDRDLVGACTMMLGWTVHSMGWSVVNPVGT
jgi:hypothetical protein